MATPLRVLIVEDSASDALVIVRGLERGGYSVDWQRLQHPTSIRAALLRQEWDVIVADYGTQEQGGFDTLALLRERRIETPFILVLESLNEALAIEALRAGAHDYVMKSHAARLIHAVERGIAESRERRERRRAEEALRARERMQEEERTRHAVELARQRIAAQEAERQRISRELHDEIGQALATLLMYVDLLVPQIPADADELHEGIERIGAIARRALDGTRAISHDLRPTILDDVGLAAALRWLAHEYSSRHGGSITVEISPEKPPPLAADLEVALFRIAQEALTNAGKHAHAARVCLSLSFTGQSAMLVIEDDGQGFVPDRQSTVDRDRGIGLHSMRERAALLGGELAVDSAPGQGTSITASVPLRPRGRSLPSSPAGVARP
jgi:signal transduction histidine kinase